jgi:hypothetical protein
VMVRRSGDACIDANREADETRAAPESSTLPSSVDAKPPRRLIRVALSAAR